MILLIHISIQFKWKLNLFLVLLLFGFTYSPAQVSAPEKVSRTWSQDTALICENIRKGRQYLSNDLNNLDSSGYFLERAKRESMSIGFADGVARASIYLSLAQSKKGNYHLAKRMLIKALPYCINAIHQDEIISHWHTAIAESYSYLGQGDSALFHLYKAEIYAQRKNDSSRLLITYINMGSVWIINEKWDNAARYLGKAKQIALAIGDNNNLSRIYSNLAILAARQDDTSGMFTYASKSIAIAEKYNIIEIQYNAYVLLGEYYFRAENYNRALEYFQRAYNVYKNPPPELSAIALSGMGKSNLKLNNLALAKSQQLKALEIASKKESHTWNVIESYKFLAELYAIEQNGREVYKYMNIYANLRDSLKDKERNKKIDELETQYQLAEKEKEITDKELKLVKQQHFISNRNTWIAIISLGALCLAIILIVSRRNLHRKMYVMQKEEEIKQLKAMMDGEEKERSRIAAELHDGISGLLSAATINLNNLSHEQTGVTGNANFQKTTLLIREISKEVRKTAHNLMPDSLLQNDFAQVIQLHCDYLAQDKSLHIEYRHFGDFEVLNEDYKLSVYRIIQELLQNIIKHAQAHVAVVQMHMEDALLSITVEDDGIGYDKNNTKNAGMGLHNIENRVKHMNGRLSIDTEPGKGTSVYIEVDV